MKNMSKVSCLGLSLLAALSAAAAPGATPPPPPPPGQMPMPPTPAGVVQAPQAIPLAAQISTTFEGSENGLVFTKAGAMAPVKIVVKNNSTADVKISHVSTGTPALWMPLASTLTVAAGASGAVELAFSSESNAMASNATAMLRATNGTTATILYAGARFVSHERIVLEQPTVMLSGEAGQKLDLKFLNVPKGIKITGAKAPDGLTVAVDEKGIHVETTKAMNAGPFQITLVTTPEATGNDGPSDRILQGFFLPKMPMLPSKTAK